jgi:uncharacterized protein (TIGR02246 family)
LPPVRPVQDSKRSFTQFEEIIIVRKLYLTTAILTLLAAAPATAAETMTCVAVTKGQVAELFEKWNKALQTGKPDEVVKLYATDAVLLPTMSNKPRTTAAGIRDYFVHFMAKKPKGKIDSRTIRIGCNDASDVGTYTFMLTDKDGKVQNVAARYSFLYEYKDGKWQIVHHHSSAMPEKAATN